MKLIVDAFGGDNAPDEILLGCAEAAEELGIEILLAGDPEKIGDAAKRLGIEDKISKMEILPAGDVLSMEEEPTSILKEKRESSMAVGLRALFEGRGDAFSSAGNSGALVVGATMIVKRISGVKRVSFAPVLPSAKGYFMLSDAGANVECRPEMLLQFGVLGSEYMHRVMGIESPRVGLLNVGTEPHKGDPLHQEAYKLLKACPDIQFIGNVEARDVPEGICDVAVTDGFTGNVALKMFEGVALTLMGMVKDVFNKGIMNKLAGAIVYNDLKEMKKKVDYNEVGGAPIMGASKPIFKIHGDAKAKTVKNALRLTKAYVESGFVQRIKEIMEKSAS